MLQLKLVDAMNAKLVLFLYLWFQSVKSIRVLLDFKPNKVMYGGQFPQLEEQAVPGSEPASSR